MNIFQGMKNCGYYKTGLFGVCVCVGGGGGGISIHFKVFLKVKVQNGNIFLASLSFEYFWGVYLDS